MKNQIEKNHECTTESNSNFYIAVDDVTYHVGKRNKMKRIYADFKKQIPMSYLTQEERKSMKLPEYDERFFGEKFVNKPETALLNVVFTDPKDSCDKEVQKEFFSKLTFNTKNNTYVFEKFGTIGTGLPPKASHWERYLDGEYELLMERHEIQILETKVAGICLDSKKRELGVATAEEDTTEKCKCKCKCCK